MMNETLAIPPGQRLHPERPNFLTASDIGAAAGVDEFKTALELHLEKTGRKPPAAETPLMERGRLMESTAIAYVQKQLPGVRMLRPRIFVVDRDRRIGCTPDLLLEEPEHPEQLVNCQIKVVGKPTFDSWDGTPPLSYQLQTAMEGMLLDAERSVLAVLVISAYTTEMHLFDVPRHAKLEAKIERIAADFWDRIERGVMPAADYSRDAELVAALYPPDVRVETPLDLTSDNRIYELLESREKHKAAERAAKAAGEAIKTEIIEKLNGATYAVANGWKITNKMVTVAEHVVAEISYPRMIATRTKEEAA
jgi:predicted phage-related endonuclease